MRIAGKIETGYSVLAVSVIIAEIVAQAEIAEFIILGHVNFRQRVVLKVYPPEISVAGYVNGSEEIPAEIEIFEGGILAEVYCCE